jgi:glycosyltransferase involved in cell wall biosynthesis
MATEKVGTQPLVSVLIPTYNRPQYFEKALKSVLIQSYRNIEIIICDDSTNDETEKLVRAYRKVAKNIKYVRNTPRLGGVKNFRKCMDLARGQFINYLMDDDLFHPQKIEIMTKVMVDDKDIALVTSSRVAIDANDTPGEEIGGLNMYLQESRSFEGAKVADLCMRTATNLIGEPTTVLFRREMLVEPFGVCAGRQYGCNSDMASWFVLMSKGKIAYIHSPLSFLRVHEGQMSNTFHMFCHGVSDMLHQLYVAEQFGFLRAKEDFLVGAELLMGLMPRIVKDAGTSQQGQLMIESGLMENLARVLEKVSAVSRES